MNETNDQHKHDQPDHTPWWAFLTRYLPTRDRVRPGDPQIEIDDLQVTDPPTEQAHCLHFWTTQKLATLTGHLFSRPVYRSTIPGLCPICGLLPKGDRKVEHVLKIWFVDGEMCEYRFRNRTWNDCHRVTDNALHILLDDTVLTYSMELVSSITFGTRELAPDSPEVAEAERIIGSRLSGGCC